MIKVKNIRNGGSLFHYAHFICDCLFPEIVCDIFNYDEVIREKNISQTIGNFYKIYTDVMMVKHTELLSSEFNSLNINTICYQKKEKYINKINFDKFRNFIFKKYNINNLEYITDYPKVILVKRNHRKQLINDEYLTQINTNITSGKERREIKNINSIELFLKNKYKDDFKSLYFEDLEFEEQIKYFNNATLIICAHGAVMSNMFFCKEETKIIEVTCGCKWDFFDNISKILKLKHIKCHTNNKNRIIKFINEV